jgi:hypothetical protein
MWDIWRQILPLPVCWTPILLFSRAKCNRFLLHYRPLYQDIKMGGCKPIASLDETKVLG